MRTLFRLAALLVALVTLALWAWGGFHRGWTKTSVLRERPDPVVPELIERTWEKKFVPGLDFLAGGALAASLLAGISFFCRRKAPVQAGGPGPAA